MIILPQSALAEKSGAAAAKNGGAETAEKPPFPDGDASAEGLSEEALQKLVSRGQETHTSALVIIKNGKMIGQWYFGHAIRDHALHGMTKSIESLAIGKLIDEHKIGSVDEPVATFFPVWESSAKKEITLRHILSQSSGLNATTDYNQNDFVQYALDAEIESAPGKKFVYNDRVGNLLCGIVQKASGKPLDQYLAEKIFTPLGISSAHWEKDKVGHPVGLSLAAMDLARIGQLIVTGGVFEGKQIISAGWIKEATTELAVSRAGSASESYGLMWWLGHADSALGAIQGCAARGHLGQTLIVFPGQRLVVVRQVSEKSHKTKADDFDDLIRLVGEMLMPDGRSNR